MLGYDFHCEMVLKHFYIGIVPYSLDESALDFSAGVVCVMEDSEFRMTTLTVQVEVTIVGLVEIDTPVHQFLDLLRCVSNNLLHG